MNESDLDRLYERASARDAARPDAHVREAIFEEARRVIERRQGSSAGRARPLRWLAHRPRARWQIAAGLVAAALAVIVLQPMLRSKLPVTAIPDSAPPATAAISAAEPRSAPAPPVSSIAAASNFARQADRVTPEAGASAARMAAPVASARAQADAAASAPAEQQERPEARSTAITPEESRSEQLQQAAARGDLPRVRSLLQTSAVSINARDASGRTALLLAIVHRHDAIVRMLLEHGADPNIGDSKGRTALAVARDQSRTQIVDALIRAGAR